ncbi:MAG: hypothetical protein ACI81P_000919 [Neolewinella sp.]|jgi:hypothetical protein
MNCATLGLEAYVPSAEQPWDVGRIQHLYRRAGYGARPDEIEQALLDGPAQTVARLLNDAATREQRTPPEWAEWNYDAFVVAELDPFRTYVAWYSGFMDESTQFGVREKLSLFWQNHLVTQYESHSCPSYQYQYMKVIEDHAFGDFKQLIEDITITPAMLFFLNGFENTKQNPNENFARELFELFTLGENNGYTQEDIVEASRALTGWNGWTSYCGAVEWAEWGFDDTEKTVFGASGNFNYSSLITILFEQRGDLVARYICEKLYKFYVNKAVSEEVLTEMAQTFISENFQILPVLQQLFASAHFFEEANMGVLVKSPMELMTSFLRQGDFGDFENRNNWGFWSMANMGQYLGQPPDVAGWKGDRAWIDSNRITLRWQFIDAFSWAVHNNSESTYPDFAKALTEDSNSPEVIARAIVDYFIPRGLLTEEAYDNAIDALKWEIPSNYYDTGEWNLNWDSASWQIVILLRHIGRLPEFQLS